MAIPVSVVIPALNAATTLGVALKSLQAQTHQQWEAFVVDNGSSDDTPAIARRFAEDDPRIVVLHCESKGVSFARNFGLERARHDWVLFLDADDWILPPHLERLTSVAAEATAPDVIHCAWRRVASSGETMFEHHGTREADLFPTLGFGCAFAIHACLVRRSNVMAQRGFDPDLRTCEDWDLWQRIARAGARFGYVDEVLACYRSMAGSASTDSSRTLTDGLRVIDQAFAPDPRVVHPLPLYANGLPKEKLPSARLYHLVWHSGLRVGANCDAGLILQMMPDDVGEPISASGIAPSFFEALLLPTATAASEWVSLHELIRSRLSAFLAALEMRARQPGLARCFQLQLDRCAARALQRRPAVVGRIQAVTLELTKPFADFHLPECVERLHCRVELAGTFLGELEHPVCEGLVLADVLADAVAAEFAWVILRHYFSNTQYPRLTLERTPNGWTVREGATVLATRLPGGDQIDWHAAHDEIGWPLFMREVWGLGELPPRGFYLLRDARRRAEQPISRVEPECLVIELSEDLPRWQLVRPEVELVLTVGGVPVVRTPLLVRRRLLGSATIRAALTADSGFELCRACVREALLQQPLPAVPALRERLAQARRRREHRGASVTLPRGDLIAGSLSWLPDAARSDGSLAFWPRHPEAACGTSASRRALLPRSVYGELERMMTVNGHNLIAPSGAADKPPHILYIPELVWRTSSQVARPPRSAVRQTATALRTDDTNRVHFEELFKQKDDPWGYTSPYERVKYEQTLALLPAQPFRRALELACAEGHFTVQLASRVDQLLAADISSVALDRAKHRSSDFSNIEFLNLDLVHDRFPDGGFDLIVCSEVLYYTGSLGALKEVVRKIADALKPGGYFATAHAHLVVDDPASPGFDWDVPFGAKVIGETVAAGGLQLVKELRTPLYRVQLFQRPQSRSWLHWNSPEVISIPQPTVLEPEVAAHVIWQPGHRAASPVKLTRSTNRLPILMYHRIADEGPPGLRRYRTTPDQFEAQLRYLREHHFQSATLEEWQLAMAIKQPLPGRRVLLTFDDGYRDFATTAWPLLQQFGFGALVFLPTDAIGAACRWDARYGEPATVLDWSQIIELHTAGVDFGSHTASHPMLTSLPPVEMAREALRSRTALEEKLEVPINSIAYPYGDTDDVIKATFGACGYRFGLTCEHRCSSLSDSLLALPRLEVSGFLLQDEFPELLNR